MKKSEEVFGQFLQKEELQENTLALIEKEEKNFNLRFEKAKSLSREVIDEMQLESAEIILKKKIWNDQLKEKEKNPSIKLLTKKELDAKVLQIRKETEQKNKSNMQTDHMEVEHEAEATPSKFILFLKLTVYRK